MPSRRVPTRPQPPRAKPDERPQDTLRTLGMVHEQLLATRLSGLVSHAPSDAQERALSGIVLDTAGEKQELDAIAQAWQAREAMTRSGRPLSGDEFRDLAQSLLEVRRTAAHAYRSLAAACPDPGLAKRLEGLAERAAEHAAILLSMVGGR